MTLGAAIRGVARAAAYALGAFLLVASLLDLLGLMPYSDETPPFAHRLVKQLPLIAAAAVLMVPMKRFSRGVRHTVLQAAYVILSLAAAANLVHGVTRYMAGRMSWQVIPTTLVVFGIVVANAAIFWSMRERVAETAVE
ncbi:MAG TPA: hypothetical protein VH814_22225 [Steroidobacteraceae bacterium]|jgi:membrane-associated PAP2 superfamily phosphatase